MRGERGQPTEEKARTAFYSEGQREKAAAKRKTRKLKGKPEDQKLAVESFFGTPGGSSHLKKKIGPQ